MCMYYIYSIVFLYPVSINLLNESLQCGHPARSKMAVLEEDPPPAVHSLLHHALSYGSLRWEEEWMGEGRAGKAEGKGKEK